MEQNDPRDVNQAIRDQAAKWLRAGIERYRKQRSELAIYLKNDPAAPLRQKEVDRERVATEVQRLADMWSEVMPYVRRIRRSVVDVLEHNRLTACYLLFGKISRGVAAILLLAEDGLHGEAMELIRSNREAIDLVTLFLREPDDSALLGKWFGGEIVKNVKARQAFEDEVQETAKQSGITFSLGSMKSGVYGILSAYNHVSYAALLESYDPYNDDFDFDRLAGYHYVLNSSLPYLQTEIHGVIVGLKDFYSSIRDREAYEALDVLLRRYAPHMYDEAARKARVSDVEARLKKRP